MKVKILYGIIKVMLFSAWVFGQNTSIQLKDIMKGYDFVGHPPENPTWSLTGDTLYFQKKDSTGTLYEYFGLTPRDQKIFKFDSVEISKRILFTPDQFKRKYGHREAYLFQHQHLIYISENGEIDVLLQLNTPIQFLGFDFNSSSLYLALGKEIFKYDRATGSLRRIIEVQSGKDPKNIKEKSSVYTREESVLFEFLQKNEASKVLSSSRSNVGSSFFKVTTLYSEGKSAAPMAISRDGRHAIYQMRESGDQNYTKVPNYITGDGYTSFMNARPKVGTQTEPESRYLHIDLNTNMMEELDFSWLPAITLKPAYLKEYDTSKVYKPTFDKPKPIDVVKILTNETSDWMLMDIQSRDNKDRWILGYYPPDKKWLLIDHQHDEAWIGGPGVRYGSSNLGFIVGTDYIFYKSESCGYSHLYIFDISKNQTKKLTSGNFEIHDVRYESDQNLFYVTSNKSDPGSYQIYTLNLDGHLNQISQGEGSHQMILSADGKNLASLYSESNQPLEIYTFNTKDSTWQRSTFSQNQSFLDYEWKKPLFINFKASDGVSVPARIYLPKTEVKNGAAILFVHGAGYLQNAHKHWSIYYREYMFHLLLADLGYTVLDVDYRGSAGYGRDYRTAIYRHMGGRDLEDYVDAVQFLIQQYEIHPDKIGIYGGSYGGFITLMALFKYPGLFKCGAALRSVADWAHYNHGYTSNILNTPESDPEAFKRSSPIYWADGLQDYLLILHGMLDVNVHFQDVVRLNQKLIELEKVGLFDMAIYPVEDHGFIYAQSWYDEYHRILQMFERYLTKVPLEEKAK